MYKIDSFGFIQAFLIFQRYLKTSEDLIEYFAGIHTEIEMPCVVLIDNLQDFIDREKFEQVRSCFYFYLLKVYILYWDQLIIHSG